MGNYPPFICDNDVVESIMPDRKVQGIQAITARFLAQYYVTRCKDFPDLIAQLTEREQRTSDAVQKEALLYLINRGGLVWQNSLGQQ